MKITPITISIADAAVADPNRRLNLTRWPDEVGEGTWKYVVAVEYKLRQDVATDYSAKRPPAGSP